MRIAWAVSGVVVVLAVGYVVPATAQAPVPRDPTTPCPGQSGSSCGDNYLEGVTLNGRDGRLLSSGDTVDTSNATTQADLFVPGGTAIGAPEPTSCNGTPYGKTVWYDFVPHVDGDVLLQAAALSFNPTISLVRFDLKSSRPLGPFQCANELSAALEQAAVKGIKRGRAYSVQVGGVGDTGGVLEFDLNFKPYRTKARARLRIRPTAGGVEIVSLVVKPTRSARMEVACLPGCRRQVKSGRQASFSRLGGKSLRAGSRLIIRVSRPDTLGTYLEYKITRGSFRDPVERCLNRASRQPRRRCA